MIINKSDKLTRIGVFYDGNYFLHVSNYYNYVHDRKSRISIAGLHNFIRHKIAEEEGNDSSYRHYQIVDAHYFRGRLSASEASQRGNQLYFDRVFDDILMSEGVTTHYLPIKSMNGYKHEKGIDVWLALEAYELAFYKHFDVVVLIASDGDYAPLVRKLNTLGTRVMLLSWDFEYTDDFGNRKITRTSQDLLQVVTYPVSMHETINQLSQNSFDIDDMFVPKEQHQEELREEDYENNKSPENGFQISANINEEDIETSTILSLKQGYGFIKYPPSNLFFHYQNLIETDFNNIQAGDTVQFIRTINDRGDEIAIEVQVISQAGNENNISPSDDTDEPDFNTL